MSHEPDPLREPLRLLRETSLAAGFDERLAERLATASHSPPAQVIRLPSRKRVVLLLAALALPAAAASSYWIQQQSKVANPRAADAPSQAAPLKHLPSGTLSNPARPSMSAIAPPKLLLPAALPLESNSVTSRHVASPTAPRVHLSRDGATATPSAAPQATGDASKNLVAAPVRSALKIEALEPAVPRSKGSSSSTNLSKGLGTSDTLRKATEQGASRMTVDKEQALKRDANARESRGNDNAGQARERVQARERKGQ